ncbi:MAG: hypothetical protein WD889_02045 [Candidatus Colwellbacteria bacterium]
MKNKVVTLIVVGVTTISLVGLSGLFSLGGSSNSSSQDQKQNKGQRVQCLTSELFHIHPELVILVDGKQEAVPANIGIIPGCTYELHTHTTDGIIHVESAVDRGYAFADFLSIWGKPLLREGYTLKMIVDGKETTDPNFVMKDGQKIILNYFSGSQ